MSIGQRITQLRTERNMSQNQLAKAMEISRQAVSKWENGTADPSTSNLLKLAKLFGLSPEELIRAVQPEQS